jgi:chromosome segregation ATPase
MESLSNDLKAKVGEHTKTSEGLQSQNQSLQAQLDELNSLKSKTLNELEELK